MDPNALNTAWSAFSAALQRLGEEIVDGAGSPADGADGLRHLALLNETALKWFFSGADPFYPRFVQLNDTPEIADNLFAPVRGDCTYLLRGNIKGLFDVNISLHEGWPFLGQRKVWGDIGSQDLEVGPDGAFELCISPTRQPGNWLELPAEATILQIREYYEDWGRHSPGQFEIVRLGSEGAAPARASVQDVTDKLRDASRWVEGYLRSHHRMIEERYPKTDNAVIPPSQNAAGNRNIQYGFGKFRLGPGQCLLLGFNQPQARLWSIQWLLSPWYENPDLANRATSVNSHHAFVNADGRVRVVFCPDDPGVPNWIDTGQYEAGVFVVRWIWSEDSPPIDVQVAHVRDVRRLLPADTPRIDVEGRKAEQALRRRHFAMRGR